MQTNKLTILAMHSEKVSTQKKNIKQNQNIAENFLLRCGNVYILKMRNSEKKKIVPILASLPHNRARHRNRSWGDLVRLLRKLIIFCLLVIIFPSDSSESSFEWGGRSALAYLNVCSDEFRCAVCIIESSVGYLRATTLQFIQTDKQTERRRIVYRTNSLRVKH